MKSKEELLNIIKEFIVNEPSKQWRPGKDHVHYSGPYFDHTEIIRSISTLLDGWLVLGAEAYKAAATRSKTPWFFTVFAKLEVKPNFDWLWQPDYFEAQQHLFNGLCTQPDLAGQRRSDHPKRSKNCRDGQLRCRPRQASF